MSSEIISKRPKRSKEYVVTYREDGIFMLKLLFMLAMFGGLLYLGYKVMPHQDCVNAIEGTIISVGGCDRGANCGVQTTIGHMTIQLPAVGDKVGYCAEYKLKWGY